MANGILNPCLEATTYSSDATGRMLRDMFSPEYYEVLYPGGHTGIKRRIPALPPGEYLATIGGWMPGLKMSADERRVVEGIVPPSYQYEDAMPCPTCGRGGRRR